MKLRPEPHGAKFHWSLTRLGLSFSLLLSATANATPWVLLYSSENESCWEENWFLEGPKASVVTQPNGFIFSAGPDIENPESHAVLWSKSIYSGDIKVEYEYTRLDSMNAATSVNILYLLASGRGTDESPPDIRSTTTARQIPWMRSYFLEMNLLHISYAATGPQRSNYVSARRYPANSVSSFNSDTLVTPVYDNVNMFSLGVAHQITATKIGDTLQFEAHHAEGSELFNWDLSSYDPVLSGRVGFRHMWGRSSQYRNIKIYGKENFK